jgi:hypothetical protein
MNDGGRFDEIGDPILVESLASLENVGTSLDVGAGDRREGDLRRKELILFHRGDRFDLHGWNDLLQSRESLV